MPLPSAATSNANQVNNPTDYYGNPLPASYTPPQMNNYAPVAGQILPFNIQDGTNPYDYTGAPAQTSQDSATAAQGRNAFTADYGQTSADRTANQGLANSSQAYLQSLLDQSQGKGPPTAAMQQLQAGTQAADHASQSQAASMRGSGIGMSHLGAQQAQASNNAAGAQSASLLKAQQMQQAQSAYGSLSSQLRGASQAQQQADQGLAQFDAGQMQQNRANNDATSAGFLGLAGQSAQAQMQGANTYEQQAGNYANGQLSNVNQSNSYAGQNEQAAFGAVSSALGGASGAAGTMSDFRAKDEIRPMSATNPYGYAQAKEGYGYDLPKPRMSDADAKKLSAKADRLFESSAATSSRVPPRGASLADLRAQAQSAAPYSGPSDDAYGARRRDAWDGVLNGDDSERDAGWNAITHPPTDRAAEANRRAAEANRLRAQSFAPLAPMSPKQAAVDAKADAMRSQLMASLQSPTQARSNSDPSQNALAPPRMSDADASALSQQADAIQGQQTAMYNAPSPLISDARAKDRESGGGEDHPVSVMLSQVQPATFRYKPELREALADDGRTHYGVMAQDLQKSPMGASIVLDTPAGKMIDMKGALGAALAAGAHHEERLRKAGI